jgi:hypothetical protein
MQRVDQHEPSDGSMLPVMSMTLSGLGPTKHAHSPGE